MDSEELEMFVTTFIDTHSSNIPEEQKSNKGDKSK